MTHFLASVEFDARRVLPDLAADLSRACGVPLTKDDSGRFDEVPAYVGSAGEVRFTLFGPTDDQEERECILEVSFRTSLSVERARAESPPSLQSVFDGLEIDSTGHINCSHQLASLLKTKGFGDCEPVRKADRR